MPAGDKEFSQGCIVVFRLGGKKGFRGGPQVSSEFLLVPGESPFLPPVHTKSQKKSIFQGFVGLIS